MLSACSRLVGAIGVRSRATRAYTSATVTYASTIDAAQNALTCDVYFDAGLRNLTLLVLMHGYAEGKSAISSATRERFADRGFFVVVVGLRGNAQGVGAGPRDADAREIHDIYDAVIAVRAAYATYLHATRQAICGWSGGGGNALACMVKLGDFFTAWISLFGVTDPGHDPAHSWYFDPGNPTYQGYLTTDVGATPAADLKRYFARDHIWGASYALALADGQQRLWLGHDASDNTVGVSLTDRLRDLLNAGPTDAIGSGAPQRFNYRRSTASDSERYTHGYPEDTYPLNHLTQWGVTAFEDYWWPSARNLDRWTIPATGRAWVAGWLRCTSRTFSVWLGNSAGTNPKTDIDGGQLHAGRVDYNTGAGTFTIMPVTGATKVRVEFGAKVATATVQAGEVATLTPD